MDVDEVSEKNDSSEENESDIDEDFEFARTESAQRRKIRDRDLEEVDDVNFTKAMHKTAGNKVLDDPKLLAKHKKRVVAKKARSKREWEARIQQVEKDKRLRQEKRERNIQKRKDAVMRKKRERRNR